MKKYIIALAAGIIVSGLYMNVNSRVRGEARSERKFDREVVQRPFALIYFYDVNPTERHERHNREEIKTSHHAISALRRLRRYKESGLNFVTADVAQDDLRAVAQRYSVQEFPTFILLKYGQPVTTQDNNIVQLHGPASSGEIQDFIERHLGKELAKERKRYLEDRLIRAETAAYYWGSPYWYGGWGWGYPYYWSRPYWGRPYVGFGGGYYV